MCQLKEVFLNEKDILRNELRELKNCQVRYFSITITVTGLLFGWGIQHNTPPEFFFTPLLIIFPCWWIFFDKASTITRIVAYYRVLESMTIKSITLPKGESSFVYHGWENSLSAYRDLSQKRRRRWDVSLKGILQVISLRRTHRYWSINWYSFFILAFICWYFGNNRFIDYNIFLIWKTSLGYLIDILFLAFFIFSLIYVGNLTNGKYSYENSYKIWTTILKNQQ